MKAEEIEYKGFIIEVHTEADPLNPRAEYDNVGHMVCWHPDYLLGDEQVSRTEHEEAQERVKEIEKSGGIVLPLFLYDHSGITMNTTGFSCPWDSGQVGVILCTKEQIDDEWSGDAEAARLYLIGEVEVYDHYLTGNVYGYVITDPQNEEDHIDSCWGYYGDPEEYMIPQCKESIDHELRERVPLFTSVGVDA